MSFDDEFGGFLDRETMLAGGLPAKRANTLLFLIESRTAHLVAQSRQAMEVFLTREAAEERELAFLESFALGSEPPLRPTIQELERYAPQWASLVPENPRCRQQSHTVWARSTSLPTKRRRTSGRHWASMTPRYSKPTSACIATRWRASSRHAPHRLTGCAGPGPHSPGGWRTCHPSPLVRKVYNAPLSTNRQLRDR